MPVRMMLGAMRVVRPAVVGVVHPDWAVAMTIRHMNSMMRTRRVRLLQRLMELVVSEAPLIAAEAHNLEADGRQPIHAECVLGACGQIDDPTRNKRTPVVDANCDAAPGPLIAHDHARPERQALMCC